MMKPARDLVFIERESEDETYDGGLIYRPEAYRIKPIRGKVLAIGPGKINRRGERVPIDVEVGDRVIFGKFSSYEIEIDDAPILVVKASEILAKIED